MKNNIELDTKILNKNLEITKLTKQLDDLTSENVDLKVKICDNDVQLHHLLIEVHERMYSMMEYCERLQPVKLSQEMEINMETGTYPPITVDITEEEEFIKGHKLFRLQDIDEMTNYDDQTSRSILKDLRKVINSLDELLERKIGI